MLTFRRFITTFLLLTFLNPIGSVFAHGGEEPVVVAESGDSTIIIVAGVLLAVTTAVAAGVITYLRVRSSRNKD
jgi:hypothetical protein